ncbi:MAG TPA: biotin transporter BioY [Desulfobacterales bacterium]|nr:biotin transporter BioY [Desulfobacterales bacterium]
MNGSVEDKGAVHHPATAATAALRPMVHASLFAAMMAAGAYMAIPIGPVPIVLQNMFVLLSGLLLGSRWGLTSVAVYLLAGVAGLPVFAGGTGGIGRIFGPTGGFLLGYLPVVFLVGRMAERLPRRMVWDVAAMTAGTLVLYACGVAWLAAMTGLSPAKALALGMVPFLPGDALKIAAAALIARAVRPVMNP